MIPLSSPLIFLVFIWSPPLALSSVDEFMSCDRLLFEKSRSARKLMDSIPCDMSKISFCEHKGQAYPEAQIWRFKEENRALMRRLYGDLESNSVYREMRAANHRHHHQEGKQQEQHQSSNHGAILDHDLFSSLEYNIRVGSGLATVQSARKPIVTETADRRPPLTKTKVVKKKIKKKRPASGQASGQIIRQEVGDDDDDDDDDAGVSISMTTTTELLLPATTIEPQQTETGFSDDDDAEVATTTVPDIDDDEILTAVPQANADNNNTDDSRPPTAYSNYVDSAIFRTETEPPPVTETSEATTASTTIPTTTTSLPHQTGSVDDSLSELLSEVDLESLEQIVGELLPQEGQDEFMETETIYDSDAEDEESLADEAFAQPLVGGGGPSAQEISGQEDIYDDFEEEQGEIEYTGNSINACPVKEEVFAPYWANNTRNQVLALLNLYPFEQYIHMETCQYPEEQMMCREGCRCEQQYRLHRLLAFDPSNECRGIFSDWFRFPSYCICKCYNMEQSFLPKRRKPRIELKKKKDEGEKDEEEMEDNVESANKVITSNSIPAILPYEAKEALLRDLRMTPAARTNRDMDGNREIKEGHFFYGGGGGGPVIEYRQSEGPGGGKTPRKRRK